MMKWHLVLNEMELVEFCLQWMCAIDVEKKSNNSFIYLLPVLLWSKRQRNNKSQPINTLQLRTKISMKKSKTPKVRKHYTVLDEVRTTHRSLNWPTVAINQCKIKRYRLLFHKVVIQFGQECFFLFSIQLYLCVFLLFFASISAAYQIIIERICPKRFGSREEETWKKLF